MVKASFNRLALKPGTCIDKRYRIERLLGRGGFAFTYLAADLKLNRRVAVKELFYHHSVTRQGRLVVLDRPEDRDIWRWALGKFKHEAKHLAKLNRNPNIVSVNDMIEENKTAYIVMNYVEGRSLEEHLRELGRPLSAEELRPIFVQILRGLEAVHEARILHRDIKPDNIYLTDKGQVILLDFGAARPDNRLTSRLSTIVPHTHGYSPPEQYRHIKPTPALDIYSVAATMVRAITGSTPPRATEREREDLYRPVATRCAGRYPAVFLRSVDAAMSLEPGQRPATVAQWRQMLRGAPPGQPPPPILPLPPVLSRVTLSRRGVLIAATVAACVLGLAALGTWFLHRESSPAPDDAGPRTAESEYRAVLARMDRELRAAPKPNPTPSAPEALSGAPPGPSFTPAADLPNAVTPSPAPVAALPTSPPTDSPAAAASATSAAALTDALTALAKAELEGPVLAENYADAIAVNNTGEPADLERMSRSQLVDAEVKDNAAYSGSTFKQLTCRVAEYDPKQNVATLRQCFLFDRTFNAGHKRRLGLIIRDLHVLNANTSRRCIDQLFVRDKTMGYACRLSEADHIDLSGKTFNKNASDKENANDIRTILIRDRLNYQSQRHRDPEDMEFAPYVNATSRIHRVPDDGIAVWPATPANYARILAGSPVVDIFPVKDNSLILIYLPD